MDFTCPTCNVLLEVELLEEIRLWKCSSCSGFAITLPLVRKGLDPETFKKIWQKLFSGETQTGRSCPGCTKPLNELETDGQGGAVVIDVCRTCQIIWFDDKEFSELPKAEQEKPQVEQLESRLLTKADRAFAAFKEEQNKRRSFLIKLLDGSVSKELGLDSFFGDFFNK